MSQTVANITVGPKCHNALTKVTTLSCLFIYIYYIINLYYVCLEQTNE